MTADDSRWKLPDLGVGTVVWWLAPFDVTYFVNCKLILAWCT